MNAVAGDRLVIRSRHLDEPVRTGEIVEVHGTDGAPPYLVRWDGETDTVLIVPGPDAHVEHHTGGISSTQKAQTKQHFLNGDVVANRRMLCMVPAARRSQQHDGRR
jgi:hypothetical protein